MTKIKLLIISFMILLFSFFNGLQVSRYGFKSFFAGFTITLLFFGVVFLAQTLYYIAVVKRLVAKNELDISDYQSPFDIWLICIPFCVLMVISYVFLSWHLVEIFICTSFALIGMLLGNALGRGSGKWSLMKSLPFFNGVIASTLFTFIMGWLI